MEAGFREPEEVRRVRGDEGIGLRDRCTRIDLGRGRVAEIQLQPRELEARVGAVALHALVRGRIGHRAKDVEARLLRLDRRAVVAAGFARLRDPPVGIRKLEGDCRSPGGQAGIRVERLRKRLQRVRHAIAVQLDDAEVLAGVGGLQLPVGVGGVDADELLRQVAVSKERLFRRLRLPASPIDVAYQ